MCDHDWVVPGRWVFTGPAWCIEQILAEPAAARAGCAGVRVREGGEVLATVNLDRGAFACALSRGQDPQALGERLATVLADPARPAKDEQIDAAEQARQAIWGAALDMAHRLVGSLLFLDLGLTGGEV